MLWSIDFWHPTVVYNFRYFTVEYSKLEKTTYTRFPDSHFAGGPVDETDSQQATLLDLSPELYRLQRTLTHHYVGMFVFNQLYSPTIWHHAHPDTTKLPENYEVERWLVTALHFFTRDKQGPEDRNDAQALEFIQNKGHSIESFGNQLDVLIAAADII